MKSTKKTERRVNAIVEEMLDENEEEPCPGGCDQLDNTIAEASLSPEADRQCKCAVENSWRFSLRVMEAMRSLQRDPDQPSTSSAEDIVEYIRANYRSDGDLYAQVRTALRQVCSQGFVMELLENEYHLIGPVAKSPRPKGCSFDCKGRVFSTTTDDTPGKLRDVDDRETDACRCRHFSKRKNGPARSPRSLREHAARETTFPDDYLEDLSAEGVLHSTALDLTNVDRKEYRDNSTRDTSAARKERHQRRDHTVRTPEAKTASPIAGPSGVLQRSTATKIAQMKDRRLSYPRRADEENDEKTTTEEEEDLDCTCDTPKVTQEPQARKRSRDRTHRVRNKRNNRRKRVEEDAEKEEATEGEDEDAEDSVYRRLRRRGRRGGRSATRERELKRWIRRCREECERRRRR